MRRMSVPFQLPAMDIYYQMLDRESSTVSPLWKALHIFSLCVVTCSGFGTAYTIGKALEMFGNNCILFANIAFEEANHNSSTSAPERHHHHYGLYEIPRHLKPIDIANSHWGTQGQCYFCQFAPVVSMILGITWAAFFVMCSRGGAGFIGNEIYRPWKIVYPAMVVATIFTGIMLVSTLQLSAGINAFCSQFEEVFNTSKCIDAINDYTLSFNTTRRNMIIRLNIGIICSYICFGGWLLHLFSLVLRVVCLTDFQMVKITVITQGDEELLQVIDPAKAPLATIPELSPSPSNISRGGAKSLFFGKRSPQLGNKPSTRSLGSSPVSNRKEYQEVPVNNLKQNPDHRQVSFELATADGDPCEYFHAPSVDNISDNTEKRESDRNVSLPVLNGTNNILNSECSGLPTVEETSLRAPFTALNSS